MRQSWPPPPADGPRSEDFSLVEAISESECPFLFISHPRTKGPHHL